MWPAYTSFGLGQNFVQKDWVNGIFPLGPDEEGIGSTISLINEFGCTKCDKSFCGLSGLFLHNKSVHEGVKYSCTECNYNARRQGNLKLHVAAVHEGVKYSCSECNYNATTPGNLKLHMTAVHEGVKYLDQVWLWRVLQKLWSCYKKILLGK